MKYILILGLTSSLMLLLLNSCTSMQSGTDEEYHQNMRDLDIYMLSHGMQPSHEL